MIAQPAKKQLPNDSAREGKRGNVLLSRGTTVPVAIDHDKYGVDLSDDSKSTLTYDGITSADGINGQVRTN